MQIIVFSLLIIIPFLKGLFFREVFLPVNAIFIILFIFYLIKAERIKFDKRILILFLLQFGVSTVSLFTGINREEAIYGLFLDIMPICVYFVFMNLDNFGKYIKNDNGKDESNYSNMVHKILLIIFISGIIISIINFFIKYCTGRVEETVRLTWVIPYANTLALYLFLCSLAGIYILHQKNKTLSLFKKILVSIAICIIVSGMIFTFSRTMWVISIIIYFFYFLLEKNKKFLLVILMLSAILFVVYSNELSQRLITINIGSLEFKERLTYYKDSIGILKDFPLFGTGHGGWTSIQYKYQTAVYSSKYAHSSIFQTLLDHGIAGFLIYLLQVMIFIGYILHLFKNARNKIKKPDILCLILINFAILAHSLIDIDLEFPLITLIFWMNIALLSRLTEYPVAIVRIKTSKKLISVFALVLFFVLMIPLYLSNMNYLKAKICFDNGNYHLSNFYLKKSIYYNPYSSSSYYLFGMSLSEMYKDDNEDVCLVNSNKSLNSAQKYDNYNPLYPLKKALNYFLLNDYMKCADEYHTLTMLQPLDINNYEEYSTALMKNADEYFKNNAKNEVESYSKKIIKIEDEIINAKRKLNSKAYELNHKPALTITSLLAYNIGKAWYYLSNPDKARHYLDIVSKDQDFASEIADLLKMLEK